MAKPISRREFLQGSAAAGLSGVPIQSSEKQSKAERTANNSRPPNIVVIIADEFRWDNIGAYHLNPMGLTPNLDSMARRGTLFQSAITNQPLCSPSRACLFTGQYPNKHGVWRNGPGLSPDAVTLATCLRRAGYTANYVGKWHLQPNSADKPESWGAVSPEYRGGFTDFWEGANEPEDVSFPYEGDIWDTEGKKLHFSGKYRVDFYTDRAVYFLRQVARQPFLLVVSYLEPHQQNFWDRFVAPNGYAQRYTNPFVPHDLRPFPGDWQSQLPEYYGCVARVDESVGTILRTLSEQGLQENTIVAFLSDHACHFRTRNEEYKDSPHESSIHIPLVVQGPGFNRSVVVPELVSMVDVAPTLLEAAGVPIPASMQGRSAMPLVSRKIDRWRNEVYFEIVFEDWSVGRGLRTEQWTYAVRSIGASRDSSTQSASASRYAEYQMYDLFADPHELVNLSGRKETYKVALELRERLMARMLEVGEDRPEIEGAIFSYP